MAMPGLLNPFFFLRSEMWAFNGWFYKKQWNIINYQFWSTYFTCILYQWELGAEICVFLIIQKLQICTVASAEVYLSHTPINNTTETTQLILCRSLYHAAKTALTHGTSGVLYSIWHRDISSRPFWSCGLQGGASMDLACSGEFHMCLVRLGSGDPGVNTLGSLSCSTSVFPGWFCGGAGSIVMLGEAIVFI